MIRARARYICEGEKPTKFFCSLEKHCGVQKFIPKLIIERDGETCEIENQAAIENEIYKYYSELFSEKPTEITEIVDFLGDSVDSCAKLTNVQRDLMEGLLTVKEITSYLKKTKNNVAPGSSGFTNEFYKFFWLGLKVFIVNALNYGYEKGMLSITQRLGIITLIPKGNKDKTLLKNWRPLTLLNSYIR